MITEVGTLPITTCFLTCTLSFLSDIKPHTTHLYLLSLLLVLQQEGKGKPGKMFQDDGLTERFHTGLVVHLVSH